MLWPFWYHVINFISNDNDDLIQICLDHERGGNKEIIGER